MIAVSILDSNKKSEKQDTPRAYSLYPQGDNLII